MIEFGGKSHASYYPLEVIGVKVYVQSDPTSKYSLVTMEKTKCACQ
jgi:hypothetical protein